MVECIQFANRLITYEQFLEDLANKVVKKIKDTAGDPEFVSQNKAFKIFGRQNVERWRREGKIEPDIRPGKLEYRTSELRYLQSQKQDYFSALK